MPAYEVPGTFSHILYLKRERQVPAKIAVKRTGERMIVNNVPVESAHGTSLGVEIQTDFLNLLDSYVGG